MRSSFRQMEILPEDWRRSPCLSPFLVVVSAWLMTRAYPDHDLEALAWIGMTPILLRLPDWSTRQALGWAWAWGLLFYTTNIFWLFPVAGAANALLIAVYAFFTAVCLTGIREVLRWRAPLGWAVAPSMWVALEYFKAELPIFAFPWCLLGNSQYLNVPAIQVCSLTGVYGLGFLILATNCCLAFWSRHYLIGSRRSLRGPLFGTGALVIGLVAIYAWGAMRARAAADGRAVRVGLLQGNYDHVHKWSGRSLDEILYTYARLSARAAKEKPDLIVWPETAIPTQLFGHNSMAEAMVYAATKAANTYSLVGSLKAPITPGAEESYNNAFLFGPKGKRLPQDYAKRHLVPFGEYVPLNKIFFFVDIVSAGATIFLPGENATLFEIPTRSSENLKFGVLICYESIFPQMAREYVRKGADLLVVITNDAWYGATAMPYQHAAMAALRAVESGIPMVRSANTGLTCWADARGRIRGILQSDHGQALFLEGHLTAEPQLENLDTFYSRHGDLFSHACIIVTILALGMAVVGKRRRRKWKRSG